MMKKNGFILFTLIVLVLFAASCRKDNFNTSIDARINITIDTLKFDTVFTTTSSVTRSFKIFNLNDQKLNISSIKLMGGAASSFKININGIAATEQNNIELAANDSMYVFVMVAINATTSSQPFIVSDSIAVNYNGNKRMVQLQAYGQNANFLNNKIITTNTTWTNNLPYVILKGLTVATGTTLTILPGCKIYSHADAPFLVDGTLIINGIKNNEVIFTGDRLDYDYKDLPASWPGIIFRSNSINNNIKFGIIKNAYQGIVVTDPSSNSNPKITIQQTVIDNAYDAGILSTGSSVYANNCLISNCGSNIVISNGGDYNFTNCTVASYSNSYIIHKNPVLSISNFATTGSGTSTANLSAVFRNNIFWADSSGFVNNEVVVNKQGSNAFTVAFDNNIYRGADPGNSALNNNIRNQNPSFDLIDVFRHTYNFRITKNSAAPGINKGVSTTFAKDLDDKNRSNGLPDIGCYEK